MKRMMYIGLVCSCFACNSGMESDQLKSVDVIEAEESVMTAEEIIAPAIDYNAMAAQKLQDYADLLVLKMKHPEFLEEISSRLKNLSSDKLMDITITESIRIENVKVVDAVEYVSDTIQKMRFSYTIVSGTTKLKDTVTATIQSKKLKFSDEEVVSYKLSFEANK